MGNNIIITRWPRAVPQSTKLNCFILLYSTILYSILLFSILLSYSKVYYTVLISTFLHYSIPLFSTFLHYTTLLYSTLSWAVHNKQGWSKKSSNGRGVVWLFLPIIEPLQVVQLCSTLFNSGLWELQLFIKCIQLQTNIQLISNMFLFIEFTQFRRNNLTVFKSLKSNNSENS